MPRPLLAVVLAMCTAYTSGAAAAFVSTAPFSGRVLDFESLAPGVIAPANSTFSSYGISAISPGSYATMISGIDACAARPNPDRALGGYCAGGPGARTAEHARADLSAARAERGKPFVFVD